MCYDVSVDGNGDTGGNTNNLSEESAMRRTLVFLLSTWVISGLSAVAVADVPKNSVKSNNIVNG